MSVWRIEGILTGTNSPGVSGLRNNDTAPSPEIQNWNLSIRRNLLPRISLLGEVLFFYKGYTQGLLSPVDRVGKTVICNWKLALLNAFILPRYLFQCLWK